MRHGWFLALVVSWSVCAGTLLARGGWEDPPGGWDYIFEANAGEAQYVALTTGNMVSGLLNGEWRGGIETYFWDSSAPGQYDTGDAAGFAPGGAALQVVPGAGEGGGDATVLALEVAGDTTTAAGNPFAFAWTTPANEAIYFLRGTNAPGQTSGTASIKAGMTVIARWRLTPNPTDVQPPAGQNWQSAGFTTDGKGMLSVVDQSDVNASLSFRPDGKLFLMDQFELPYAGSPTQFLTTWLAIIQRPGGYQIDVFLNGGSTPVFSQEVATPPTGDETGTDPDDYIAFGLPVKGAPAAMQLDYIGYKVGFLRPGEQVAPPASLACTIDYAADPATVRLSWAIPTGATYDSIDIERDGALVATVAGTDTSYTTTELLAGPHVYSVKAHAGGQPLFPAMCTVSFCPGGNLQVAIDYDQQPPRAHLTWDSFPFQVTKIEITREGVLLTDTLAPDATEYWDATLTPADGEANYHITFTLLDPVDCPVVATRHVVVLRAEQACLEPDGGWDYVYDPDAHVPGTNPMDRYVAEKGVVGCLDGTWFRSNQNDYWDGSAPGAGNGAPGGIEIRDRPGAGLNGEDTKTIAIEDPGDPTGGGYPDPSNRKIVLGHELEPPANLQGGRFAEGVTLYARFRILPDPRDVQNPPNGDGVRDSNRGMITLYYYDGDTTANGSRSWGMSLNGDTLALTDGGDLNGLRPGEFVSVWFNTQDTDRNGNYHSNLYINGDTAPLRSDWRSGLDNYEEGFFVDTAKAYTALSLGMHTSANDGAFELDFVKVKYGVFAPQSGTATPAVTNLACVAQQNDVTLAWVNGDTYESIEVREGAEVRATLAGDATQTTLAGQPDGAHTYAVVATKGGVSSAGVTCSVTLPVIVTGERFFRGDVNQDTSLNIADAVSLLSHLFGGRPAPACPDSADCNDDGKLNIADAIALLGHLFGGRGELPPPSAKTCGTDPNADTLATCVFPQCANP